jgi:group I intron endonuclease
MIVYVATNKINGKQYIGYTTKSLNTRIKGHLKKAYDKNGKHYNYHFQKAIRKYSINNFSWDILFKCSNKQECCAKEIEYIKIYNSLAPNGYNLTQGGDGGIQSDLTKLKISNSVKLIHKLYPEKYDRMKILSYEERSLQAKKAWQTKKDRGYKKLSGYKMSIESKEKMSNTKNKLNKCQWINVNTNEIVSMSLTEMSKYTGLTIGAFNHIKQGRRQKTKCGWQLHIN